LNNESQGVCFLEGSTIALTLDITIPRGLFLPLLRNNLPSPLRCKATGIQVADDTNTLPLRGWL
jgi:hypothetical protein